EEALFGRDAVFNRAADLAVVHELPADLTAASVAVHGCKRS
ncbi:MAG: hypothetical protein ACI91B_003136, partial [Planctomycetota bacterium]